jgi:hypothetical protein
MKSNIISAVLVSVLSFGAVSAQETLVNKNGVPILPVAGDIGLGFNAIPVLNFGLNAVNIMNNTGNMAQHPGFVNHLGQNVIFGRYFLTDKTAARAHFRFGRTGETWNNYVTNDTQNDPDSLVMDVMKYKSSVATIGGGYEFRRGKGRIQGFYGGDVFCMFGRSHTSIEYANQFGQLNGAPTSTDFLYGYNNGNYISGDGYFESMPMGERVTEIRGGNTFGIGVRPFIGVEYFMFPNVSLGAEFGWTLAYTSTSEAQKTTEFYELGSGNVLNYNKKVAGSRGSYIDTETFSSALFLLFYF